MTDGYRALRESAGLLDISARARVRAGGEDRIRLLHALATNVIEGLAPGQGTETFFLSAQGRIQAHCRIYVSAADVLLETSAARRQALLDYLDSYIVMDDVVLEDVTGTTAALALEGPAADSVARQAFGAVPEPAPHSHCSAAQVSLYRSSLSGSPGLWIGAPLDSLGEARRKLLDAGAVEVSGAEFDTVRVENRVPAFDLDYFDTNIPHETQQFHLVSFTKGCYTGQEIVERVRSQGRVNRLLAPIEIDAGEPPADVNVTFEGKQVGRATSLIASPRSGKAGGFAILRREAAEPGASILVGGAPGRALAWTG
jgi:aminomethyltransferase